MIDNNQQNKLNEHLRTFEELFSPDKKNMIFCVMTFFIILFCALLRGGKGTGSIIGLD